jgi:crossover junction endodeoxyribonuclease RuvC
LTTDRIILGIDPGTTIMGYGLIHQKNKDIELITFDIIKLGSLANQPVKLKKIFESVSIIINNYHPDEMAIEAPFYGKNIQSMLKLGRAQGVAMAAALNKNIPIFEYSPRKIKQSVTGKGNSSKLQVAAMLASLLSINELPKYLDATDALAVAMCHYFQKTDNNNGVKGYSTWNSFVSQNPDRVKK